MGSKIADLCISSHVRSRNSSLPNVRVNKIEKKRGKEVEKAKHYNQKKEWGCKQQNQSAASATRKHWLTDGNNNVTEEADWVTRSRASRGPSLRNVLALLESDDDDTMDFCRLWTEEDGQSMTCEPESVATMSAKRKRHSDDEEEEGGKEDGSVDSKDSYKNDDEEEEEEEEDEYRLKGFI